MTTLTQSNRHFPWRLTTKIVTAIIGGYLFANALSIFLANALPWIRAEMVADGLLFAFIYWMLVILWVFAHQSLQRGCGGVWIATIILAGIAWLIGVSV